MFALSSKYDRYHYFGLPKRRAYPAVCCRKIDNIISTNLRQH